MKRTLKEHRHTQHLSQQELADRSGISLRTVQRLEKNTATGSPYVIRALCTALHIEMEDLLIKSAISSDNKMQPNELKTFNVAVAPGTAQTCKNTISNKCLKIINFGSLSVLVFPFLNLVISSGCYLICKKKLLMGADKSMALKILSFQLVWSLLTIMILIFTPLLDYLFLHIGTIEELPLFIWVYLVLLLFHLITTLNIAARLNKGVTFIPYIPDIL